MILTISQLLLDLRDKELAKLGAENLRHGPTIGSMYEGLTKDILTRTIPAELDLRIVDGFVESNDGQLSRQIDAMLVCGQGRPIPYTESYVWPLNKVLAIIEVKKTLYGSELEESLLKFKDLKELHHRHIQTADMPDDDLERVFKSFALITGHYPKSWEAAKELPEELSYIFHSLMVECVMPVRILIGYEGYVDEVSLRKGFIDFVEGTSPNGWGPCTFPSLIMCRDNALVKLNGLPYCSPATVDGCWSLIASCNKNPLRILIEMIWTKICNRFRAYFPPDDTLENERLASVLTARFGRHGSAKGWAYVRHEYTKRKLLDATPSSWAPHQVDERMWVLLHRLAVYGDVDVHQPELTAWGQREGFDVNELIQTMLDHRLIAWSSASTITTIADEAIFSTFFPDGTVVATDDSRRLPLWLLRQIGEKGAG